MDNEPIFTEYELSLKRARQEANKLASEAKQLADEANWWLGGSSTWQDVLVWGYYCQQKIELIKYDEAQKKFVPRDPHYNLHTPTMEFVTPEELKRRDAENVKRLQEISGK